MITEDDGTNMLCCGVLKHAELVIATSNDVRKIARYLERQHPITPPDDFKVLQQTLGMTYHKHALLLDRRLDAYVDVSDVYLHDWMHCIFVDGVFNCDSRTTLKGKLNLECHFNLQCIQPQIMFALVYLHGLDREFMPATEYTHMLLKQIALHSNTYRVRCNFA